MLMKYFTFLLTTPQITNMDITEKKEDILVNGMKNPDKNYPTL